MWFIENRVWLGPIFDIPSNSTVRQVYGEIELNGALTRLVFRVHTAWTCHPEEQAANAIVLTPVPETLSMLKPHIENECELPLIGFHLCYMSTGFFSTMFSFKVPDGNDGSDLEATAIAISRRTAGGSLIDLYTTLYDALHSAGMLRGSQPFTFGRPPDLNHEELPVDESYFYSSHYFMENTERAERREQIIRSSALSPVPLQMADCVVYPGEASFLWESDTEWTIDRIHAAAELETLTLSTALAYGIGAQIYTAMLRRIVVGGPSVPVRRLRDLMNLNNYRIQAIQAEGDAIESEQQKACLLAFATHSHVAAYAERYHRAERTLLSATEGLATRDSHTAEITVQTILVVFTALTAYSVLNDVVSYISDSAKPIELIWSLRSKLILALTFFIAAFSVVAVCAMRRKE